MQDGVTGLKSLSPSFSIQARHGRGVSLPVSWTVTDNVPVPAWRRLGQANTVRTMAVVNIFPDLLFRIVLLLKKPICTNFEFNAVIAAFQILSFFVKFAPLSLTFRRKYLRLRGL
jgi:hypothetical protein